MQSFVAVFVSIYFLIYVTFCCYVYDMLMISQNKLKQIMYGYFCLIIGVQM